MTITNTSSRERAHDDAVSDMELRLSAHGYHHLDRNIIGHHAPGRMTVLWLYDDKSHGVLVTTPDDADAASTAMAVDWLLLPAVGNRTPPFDLDRTLAQHRQHMEVRLDVARSDRNPPLSIARDDLLLAHEVARLGGGLSESDAELQQAWLDGARLTA